MDGHCSHYTLDVLRYAQDNNIIILGYPPHCTHVLQGLDVVCFAKMKSEFHKEIHVFEDLHMTNVSKKDFAGVFGRAYLRAFTLETIKAAFAATGLYPFNPDAITEKQMKPSLPTSTESTFPLPQPSPVCAIIAAMGSRPPTQLETSPSHFPTVSTNHRRALSPSPVIPARRPRELRDPNIDPSLDPETPSKRMRIMYGALASTSTGSVLLSKAHLTSSYSIRLPVLETPPELPQPDWSLLQPKPSSGHESPQSLETKIDTLTSQLSRARDIIRARELMDEQNNAQLIIQYTELHKFKQTLATKEGKKKEKRTTLFKKGLGRHLPDPERIQALADQEREKEVEVEAKTRRAALREAKNAAKTAAEEEWKVIKAAHEAAVAEWQLTCEALKAAGTRKKDLPSKPKRPPKPKPVLNEPPEGNEEEDSSDSSSSDEE
jgi:hypothetical protein